MANKSSGKKTMDVSKPGESTPNTSARPIVVSHQPMVQDSTMVTTESKPATEASGTKPITMTHSDKVIQPVGEDTPAETDETSEPKPKQPAETIESTEQSETPETSGDEQKTEKPESDTSGTEAAVVDAVVDQATEDKKKQNQLSDEEKARQAVVQKLVEEKKYFVPVGQVSHRRNQRVLIVLLALLVLLAAGYLALDAGLVESPVELPIDLIKN